MAKDDAERLAASRVRNILAWPYSRALRAVREQKTEDINWGQAADKVLAEQAGPGLFEAKEDAQ